MNEIIERELQVIFANADVEDTIAAFERLRAATKEEDIPRLVEALKSNKSDFWTRELLAQPICEIGGPEYLRPLLDVLAKGDAEGHDNDGFAHFLMEMAGTHPAEVRQRLEQLMLEDKYRKDAEWLLEFCK